MVFLLGPRDERLCRQKASLFMRQADDTAGRLVMSPVNEEK